MPYELKQEDVFGFASSCYGGEYRQKGKELVFKYCPYCHGGEHKDRETFSINLESGAFCCLRGTCGEKGHFVELARDFGYKLDFGDEKKFRVFPKGKFPKPSTPAVQYLKTRDISEAVAQRYYIASAKNKQNCVVFPFYDENNVLQTVKYRNTAYKKGKGGSKEFFEKNCKPILFGMAQANEYDKPLIITEGQIDSLTLAECGIPNAVSVPGGCNNFNWFQYCANWMNRFPKVIVFGDYENGHMTLIDALRSRLQMPVYEIGREYYLGEKDANDIYRKYGSSAIIKAVENARLSEVKFVKRLANVKTVDIYSMERIRTGFTEIDRVIGGLFFGQVILISGKRGEGKSTFGSMLIAEALDQNYPTFIYSGELPDYYFKNWLDLQLAGRANICTKTNSYGDETYYITDEISETINRWYYDKAYIFDNTAIDIDTDEFEGLLKIIEKAICSYGIRFVFIDNLMTALECDINTDLYRSQSAFVKSLAKLAKKYDVAIALVAHPKKGDGDFSNDSVSGSADITNAVDVVMCYQRAKPEDDFHSTVIVTKNRLTGRLITKSEAVELYYSPKSKRIVTRDDADKVYGCFRETVDLSGFVEIPWE